MNRRQRLSLFLARLIGGSELAEGLAAVTARVDDDPGWRALSSRAHDREPADMRQAYADGLEAWRKHPMAWRAIQICTDYVVGEQIQLSSGDEHMGRFIQAFWHHPQNRMGMRLETMCEELARSGDLFPLLFRSPADGMSYLRFITKDQIVQIETRGSDWETETVYHQQLPGGLATKRWYSMADGRSRRQRAVGLHYSINRPMGAQFGESDLATVIPWLLRYSRLLEGRIRLHWAARAFLWFVTVPTGKVSAKAEAYRQPPEPGSVIVKDSGEEWDMKTPNLRGSDAQHDMKAARNMIDAGTGFPPHWRGEAQDVNLATAKAMQEPTERHLARRQKQFVFILEDIVYQAYRRAHELFPERWPMPAESDYSRLFTAAVPDISREDNQQLAAAARDLSAVTAQLGEAFPGSPTLKRLMLRLVLKFAGEPQGDEALGAILSESAAAAGGIHRRE